MVAQLDWQVSGNKFGGLVGRTQLVAVTRTAALKPPFGLGLQPPPSVPRDLAAGSTRLESVGFLYTPCSRGSIEPRQVIVSKRFSWGPGAGTFFA
jgi:hypothetical protein